MSKAPRHDIRGHVDAIIDIASQLDPNGIDAAIADMPGAWDIASITGERHGYGYHAILNCGSSGYRPQMGYGSTIAKAIRAASDAVDRAYPRDPAYEHVLPDRSDAILRNRAAS